LCTQTTTRRKKSIKNNYIKQQINIDEWMGLDGFRWMNIIEETQYRLKIWNDNEQRESNICYLQKSRTLSAQQGTLSALLFIYLFIYLLLNFEQLE
jgi:hypothetical protein